MLWNLLCTSLLQSCTCVENSSLHHSKARSTQADKHTTSSLPILDFWWKRICPQLSKKFTSSCNCLNSVMARKEAMSGSFKIVLNLRSYCFSASLKAFEASTPSSLLSHPCKPQPDLKTGYSRCKSNSPCHKHKNFKWKMHTSQIINNSDVGGGEEKQATHHPILQKTRHGDTWVEITYEHGSRPYCKEQLELLQHLVSSQEQNRIELKHLSPSTRKVHHIQPKEEKNKVRVSFQKQNSLNFKASSSSPPPL